MTGLFSASVAPVALASSENGALGVSIEWTTREGYKRGTDSPRRAGYVRLTPAVRDALNREATFLRCSVRTKRDVLAAQLGLYDEALMVGTGISRFPSGWEESVALYPSLQDVNAFYRFTGPVDAAHVISAKIKARYIAADLVGASHEFPTEAHVQGLDGNTISGKREPGGLSCRIGVVN